MHINNIISIKLLSYLSYKHTCIHPVNTNRQLRNSYLLLCFYDNRRNLHFHKKRTVFKILIVILTNKKMQNAKNL